LEKDPNDDLYLMPILLVDDKPEDRTHLQQALRQAGFRRLQTAVSGADALTKLAQQTPDLVISDLSMRGLGARPLCQGMRNHPHLQDIPVLVHTSQDIGERIAALEAGASDVMVKPIHFPELLVRIRILLKNRLIQRQRDNFNRRFLDELRQAAQAQRSLLPDPEDLQPLLADSNLQIDWSYRPGFGLGGDLLGIRPLSDREIALFLFDFCGHGMEAALNTFRLHALIAENQKLWGEPKKLLGQLNAKLCAMLPTGQFATFFWGVVDSHKQLLRFASAGSPGCLYTDARTGDQSWLDTRGFPLGVSRQADYSNRKQTLSADSHVLLFSDAILDAGAALNERRIAAWVASALSSDRQKDLIGELERNILDISSGHLEDDLTLLSLRLSG
jgi:sigma-B regulation protein RsbU (phosphoserine phosphatase)